MAENDTPQSARLDATMRVGTTAYWLEGNLERLRSSHGREKSRWGFYGKAQGKPIHCEVDGNSDAEPPTQAMGQRLKKHVSLEMGFNTSQASWSKFNWS